VKDIRIGLIGTGGMGKAHATAFKNIPLFFGNEPGRPILEMVADVDAKALEKWASEFGFARWTTNWHDVI
jgi:predicted dehydrogenase